MKSILLAALVLALAACTAELGSGYRGEAVVVVPDVSVTIGTYDSNRGYWDGDRWDRDYRKEGHKGYARE
jgi:hypothetical protein